MSRDLQGGSLDSQMEKRYGFGLGFGGFIGWYGLEDGLFSAQTYPLGVIGAYEKRITSAMMASSLGEKLCSTYSSMQIIRH